MIRSVLDDDEGRHEALVARVPLGRLGDPSDLTGLAVYLAGDESSYVTGQIIHVDGGALVLGWTSSQTPIASTTE